MANDVFNPYDVSGGVALGSFSGPNTASNEETNLFDTLLDAPDVDPLDTRTQAPNVQAAFTAAVDFNPEQLLRMKALAGNTAVEKILGQRDLNKAESRLTVDYARRFVEAHPNLKSFLLNPENARLTHDDLQNLQEVSRLIHNINKSEENTEFGEHLRHLWSTIGLSFKQSAVGIAAQQTEFQARR